MNPKGPPARLDYCAVLSACGREVADELFGRKIPSGIDMDFLPDQEVVSRIAAERSLCDECSRRLDCGV